MTKESARSMLHDPWYGRTDGNDVGRDAGCRSRRSSSYSGAEEMPTDDAPLHSGSLTTPRPSADRMTRTAILGLAAAAFAALSPFPAAAAPTMAGRIVHSNNTTTPQYKTYDPSTNAFTSQTAPPAGAIPAFMVDRASPTRTEHIAGYVSGTTLYVMRWNGASWSNEWNVVVGGDGWNGRRFDIAYESLSGDAIVVYSTTTNNQVAYQVWNGTQWSAGPNLTIGSSNYQFAWVKLRARPTTDEIALTVCNTGNATTANTASLYTVIWSGTAWGTASSAHATSIYSTGSTAPAQSIQNDLFDMAWQSTTGGVFVFFTHATAGTAPLCTVAGQCVRYWNRTSWANAASLNATARTPPLQMVADGDPQSDSVVVLFDRSASTIVYANACQTSGTCSTASGTVTGVTSGTTAFNKKTIALRWLVAGSPATSYAVAIGSGATAGTITFNRATVSGTTLTWGTAGTQAYGTLAHQWLDSAADPIGRDTLMLTMSDSNSYLWAKRLVYDGTNFTWTNADGGTALTTALSSITSQNFAFAYDRYVTLTLGEGGTVSDSVISLGQVAPLDAFTLTPGAGTAAVGTVAATLTGYAALQNVFVNSAITCNGTTYGTLAPSGAIATITTSGLSISAATTLYLCGKAGGPLVPTIVTGVVTGATAPGYTTTGSQSSATQVTVNPPPLLTLASGTDTDGPDITVDGIARLDGFTLTAQSGTASVTSITVNLTNPTALQNVFIHSSSTCTGATQYGSVTSPATSPVTIATSGLSVGTTAVPLYVCGTGGLVASATVVTSPAQPVTVASAAATGYNFTGTDTNTTISVSVLPAPDLTLATGTDTDGPDITVDGIARLDGFTLTAQSGTASVTSITVNLTNPTALQNVFIHSSSTCTGATQYGSVASPSGAQVVIATSGLSVGTSPVPLYVCGTGALVGASTPVYPATVASAKAIGYESMGSDTNTTIIVNVIPPTNHITITTGALPEPTNATLTYAYPSPVAAIDKFTLAAPTNGVSVTSITASVQTTVGAAVKNVFIYSTSTCTLGTKYGTLGGSGGVIPITTTLSIGTAATTLWLCITAGPASGIVSGAAVTAARANGHDSTGSSSSTTQVTVNVTPTPTISIVNPGSGAVVTAGTTGSYRVQAHVYMSTGIPGVAPDAVTVALSTNGGSTFDTPMTQNGNYNTGVPTTATIYEATLTNPALGAVTLKARATTGNLPAGVPSEPASITIVAAGKGDGNLLVRDNANQLCTDCHALQTHSSEGTGLQYGSWTVQCRDCHTPHKTRNIVLVRESITPPTLGGGPQTARSVGFVKKTGDSGANGWDTTFSRPTSTASYVNSDYTGPCQVCHTRTQSPADQARFRSSGTTDSHYTGAATMRCAACHMHKTGFKGGNCISCHSTEQAITVGPLAGAGNRRAVVGEFGYLWSHKRSAGGAVTQWDCVVCHMEGDSTTGGPSSVHANGYVNLRDPDTGSNIKGVTFGGAGAGAYSSTSSDVAFPRFGRDLGSATLEPEVQAIMINQCLKCHDGNGAQSASARVPGGTAGKPFGTTIAGAGYAGGTGLTACATGTDGCVTNIDASFNTANAAYHPINGRQNNTYVPNNRMQSPWNALNPEKTPGVLDANQWGYLISCWDCHAATGANGPQTSTVTAHGGSVTVRSDIWSTTSGLCKTCHIPYLAGGSTSAHGLGSAFNSNTNSGMSTYIQNQCHYCHASGVTKPQRPQAAEDVHGSDAFGLHMGTDKAWPIGATDSYKPFAFMRNVGATYSGRWISTNWKPLSGPGVTAGTATCGGTMSATNCGDSMTTYTPGGAY